jgi:hypothetical protein
VLIFNALCGILLGDVTKLVVGKFISRDTREINFPTTNFVTCPFIASNHLNTKFSISVLW